MAIVNIITANCENNQLSQQMVSRQWDDKGTLIQFAGYPEPEGDEALIFRLIVWMKESEDAEPRELPPILLDSDQWLISNYYTQLVQTIKFQLCITNETGTYEKHSPVFAGHIGRSLSHNGQEGDIDVIPLFDPYMNYVDEKVNDLIVAAGDVQIDASLSTSGAAADAKATGDAIAGVNGRLDLLGYGVKSFEYTNGTAHSARNDVIYLPVLSGETFKISVNTTDSSNFLVTPYGYKQDGTSVQLAYINFSGSGAKEYTASDDFVGFGLYIGNSFATRDVTWIAKKTNSVFSRIDNLEQLSDNVASIEDAIQLLEYTYSKADVRTGSLQSNGTTTSSTNSIANGPTKVPLSEGATAVFVPEIPDDATAKIRIVSYPAGDSTSGTTVINLVDITSAGYTYTQRSGFTHILVGIYYYKSEDGSSYDNILNQFSDDEHILTITDKSKYERVATVKEVQSVQNEILSVDSKIDDALEYFIGLNGVYDYTQNATWEIGSILGATGTDYDNNTRAIRTQKIYIPNDAAILSTNNLIEFVYAFKYIKGGAYIERLGNGERCVNIPGGYDYRFACFAKSGTVITDETISEYSADAKICGQDMARLLIDADDFSGNFEGVVIGTDLIKRSVSAQRVGESGTLKYGQSFLIYNGKYYSTDGNNIAVQDSAFAVEQDVAISLGHGNAFQLGYKHPNFGYVSGWNDNKVYVVNLDTLAIDSTIDLPTTGYTTCAVDDVNGIVYIFQRETYPNTEANYNFIVYDYVNNTTKATYVLSEPFGAMQACDIYQDKIIVLNGTGSNLPNGYRVYNTIGQILSSYRFDALSSVEPEGVFIDRTSWDLYICVSGGVIYEITD